MTRRQAAWVLGGLVAVALVVGGFLAAFEEVPTMRHEGARREAQQNPWLAAERLLARLDRPLQRLETAAALATLPPGGVLVLDRGRRRSVTPEIAAAILAWVAAGGYLIVAAETDGRDSVLEPLGVSSCPATAAAKASPINPACTAARAAVPYTELHLPDDAGPPFRVRNNGTVLLAPAAKLAWPAGNSGAWLHLRHGRGHVTVGDGLDFLHNRALARLDHAEWLWALLQRYQPQGEIRLATRLGMPSLGAWLVAAAPQAVLAAGVLLALWLWRVVPRFGARLPTALATRRELNEHLAAIGRCLWRREGLRHWQRLVRDAVLQRVAARHPEWPALAAGPQRRLLARLGAASEASATQILAAERTATPREFVTAMQVLQAIDRARPAPVAAASAIPTPTASEPTPP